MTDDQILNLLRPLRWKFFLRPSGAVRVNAMHLPGGNHLQGEVCPLAAACWLKGRPALSFDAHLFGSVLRMSRERRNRFMGAADCTLSDLRRSVRRRDGTIPLRRKLLKTLCLEEPA